MFWNVVLPGWGEVILSGAAVLLQAGCPTGGGLEG